MILIRQYKFHNLTLQFRKAFRKELVFWYRKRVDGFANAVWCLSRKYFAIWPKYRNCTNSWPCISLRSSCSCSSFSLNVRNAGCFSTNQTHLVFWRISKVFNSKKNLGKANQKINTDWTICDLKLLLSCSIDKVPKISSPVLVIHGTEDEVIDFSHGLAIYEKCPRAVDPLWVEVRKYITTYQYSVNNWYKNCIKNLKEKLSNL